MYEDYFEKEFHKKQQPKPNKVFKYLKNFAITSIAAFLFLFNGMGLIIPNHQNNEFSSPAFQECQTKLERLKAQTDSLLIFGDFEEVFYTLKTTDLPKPYNFDNRLYRLEKHFDDNYYHSINHDPVSEYVEERKELSYSILNLIQQLKCSQE